MFQESFKLSKESGIFVKFQEWSENREMVSVYKGLVVVRKYEALIYFCSERGNTKSKSF